MGNGMILFALINPRKVIHPYQRFNKVRYSPLTTSAI